MCIRDSSYPANETRYDLQDMFGAGKVAMMIGPNNIPTYLSDGGYDINYDVTTIPANEGCESIAMGVCDRLEVFKDDSAEAVSYTHLDVYKRQLLHRHLNKWIALVILKHSVIFRTMFLDQVTLQNQCFQFRICRCV